MKRTLLSLFLVSFAHVVQAQTFFSLQYQVAEPTGNFRDVAGTGKGVSFTYMHFTSQYMALSGSLSYLKWGPRFNVPPGNPYEFMSVPVQIGGKLLLAKGAVAPYIGLALGMDYVRLRSLVVNSTSSATEDKSELKFCFEPHLGVGIQLAKPIGLLLSGSYHIIYTNPETRFFGMKAGIVVGY